MVCDGRGDTCELSLTPHFQRYVGVDEEVWWLQVIAREHGVITTSITSSTSSNSGGGELGWVGGVAREGKYVS